MIDAGVPIEFSKGEAAPGQHEVNIHYDDASNRPTGRRLQARSEGDRLLNGCGMTFMAKPDQTGPASSHVHMSLWDVVKDVPLKHATCRDKAGPYGISKGARILWPG